MAANARRSPSRASTPAAWTLRRASPWSAAVSGFYTYDEYTHPASYPFVHVGENRFILEDMNPTFDWISVDKDRNMLMSNAPGGTHDHSRQGAEHLHLWHL